MFKKDHIKTVQDVKKWIISHHGVISNHAIFLIDILLNSYKIQEKRIKKLKDIIKMQNYELNHLHKFIKEMNIHN